MDTRIPSPLIVQHALRTTTERLARELAQPTELAPDWSDFEWRVARAVAAMHGVSPLLSAKLRWQGPASWNEFLRDQRAHTAARHPRIMEFLQLIDARARDEGIPLVALKGAELHSSGLYAPGERPMADVDLLVQGEDLSRAVRMLESLGLRQSLSTWRERIFVPTDKQPPGHLGEHADNYLKVELHERLQEALPFERVDVSDRVFPSQPQPGLNRYPSRASLMTHLLLHAAGAMVTRALRLLHVNDLALLSSRMTDADWDQVLARHASGRGLWWALPPLQLTHRYYPTVVPARVFNRLARETPSLLRMIARRRTMTDVSLSYVWIEAFPGIEWSQSFAETARYMMHRIAPRADVFEIRKQLAQSEVAKGASEWQHLPQGRRMWRWVTSRPTRVDTMYAIQMALGQQQLAT